MDYQTATKLILVALPDTEVNYVFGSQARNDAHRESDVDLAVLATAPIDALVRFDLQERDLLVTSGRLDAARREPEAPLALRTGT